MESKLDAPPPLIDTSQHAEEKKICFDRYTNQFGISEIE